jgi:putative membrane protein
VTTAAEAPVETPWRRLSPRMLLVHPVQEVVRAAPALLGLIIAGSNNGNGGLWGLAGVAIAIGAGMLRWFTTSFRITDDQVQVRRGLLRRRLRAVSRDRVRTVDVSANPLQRALGLVRVTVGTGRSDRTSDGGLRLDGIDAAEAAPLRDSLLHERLRAAEAPTRPVPTETEIARLRPAWLRYAPFTLSGVITIGAVFGFVLNAANDAHVDPRNVGPIGDLVDAVKTMPLAGVIVAVLAAFVVVVAVFSTAGYLLAFWGFRLTRHSGGTLHVARGLLSTRATTIEERRLRGVELSEPLLLRAAGGARCVAIATGLRVGRGAERGGSLLFPPGPRDEARRVATEVLRTDEPLTCPLTPHGPRATRRRFTRALAGALAIVVAAFAVATVAGWPPWVWLAALAALPAAAALAADRARSLGHTVTATTLVTRLGSIVRRRAMLSREGIIGFTLRRSFFQRRAGLTTLTATTAAGRQAYAVPDVAAAEALRVCEEAAPGLLEPFRARPEETTILTAAGPTDGTRARDASRARPRSGR